MYEYNGLVNKIIFLNILFAELKGSGIFAPAYANENIRFGGRRSALG